ncbi:hypothetical protein Daus18300_005706 [Diaporthe australafricana]|uniref:Protein kinase domain-containing protein n=1 Tax=Diaporthe australafricana TaxID=127596 RepID=A0ABR3WZR8_9PEZI
MVHTAPGLGSGVQDMVSYFEKKGNQTAAPKPSLRRRSITMAMNFTRRPWEHFPRRKSSASTNPRRKSSSSFNPRRRSSTSTASDSTTYDLAEQQLGESFYSASEGSATSTVASEGRRWSVNPDYDWENDVDQDEIAALKAGIKRISLGSPTVDSDTSNELRRLDSSSTVEEKWAGPESPGVHEIDFVDFTAPETAVEESRSRSTKRKSLTHHQIANEVDEGQLEVLEEEADEGERVDKPMTSDLVDNTSDVVDSAQPVVLKGSTHDPVESEATNIEQLRLKTFQFDKNQKPLEATSPSPTTPSPKSKTRPKLALELPGIPEAEAETLGRRRKSPLSGRRLATQSPAMHVNNTSRPPVSLRRYPIRSLSSPLSSQDNTSPTQMMDLINQRQTKFTNIREEKRQRLSSVESGRSFHRPQGLMGRRHASCPDAEEYKSSTIEYRPLKVISNHEKLKYYRPGGLHPVLINDRLGRSGRFVVLRKLGRGTFATVWMCWDKKATRLRAVKVMQADSSEEAFVKEVGLLKLLSDGGDQFSIKDAYKNHLAVPLEHFWQYGPNGRHLCTVMRVLGPNVVKAKVLGDVDFLKDVCSQVITGLALLHGKGLAHGDVHPGNILMQTMLSDLKMKDIKPLLTQFGFENLYAEGYDGPGPHAPKHIYEPMDWSEIDVKYLKKEVVIIDFGACFKTTDPPGYDSIDVSLRAPEQFFDRSPSQAGDLWALGCTLMHILGSNNPFREIQAKGWSPVHRWEDALGPLPEPYRARWIRSRRDSRKRKYEERDESEPVSLEPEVLENVKRRRLEDYGTEDVIPAFLSKPTRVLVPVDEQQDEKTTDEGAAAIDTPKYKEWSLPREELESAVDLLRSVFKYKPEDRTKAKELLAHPFLARTPPPPPTQPTT